MQAIFNKCSVTRFKQNGEQRTLSLASASIKYVMNYIVHIKQRQKTPIKLSLFTMTNFVCENAFLFGEFPLRRTIVEADDLF